MEAARHWFRRRIVIKVMSSEDWVLSYDEK